MTMDHTRPDRKTVGAEDAEASAEHRADRYPTEDEERAAEESELDPEVASNYKEAIERGANAKGEGAVP